MSRHGLVNKAWCDKKNNFEPSDPDQEDWGDIEGVGPEAGVSSGQGKGRGQGKGGS